jgi:predicted permease
VTAWLRALALLVVPRDWRETVRGDLAADFGRRDARRLSTARYMVEAIRIGVVLRWRDRRLPAPAAFASSLGRLPFELRLAVRTLRRAPWFTATVVGVMTLVLSLATTVFAIVDGVLFRPLPYPEGDGLFVVTPSVAGYPEPEGFVPATSAADITHWSAAAPDVRFTGYSAANWVGFGTGVNDDTGAMARIRPEFFDVIGIQPMMGGFVSADFEREEPISPVIITWDLWQGRFQGRPDILGHVEYSLGSTEYGVRVAGVMPPGFWFPSDSAEVQFLRPYVVSPEQQTDPTRRGLHTVVARVPAGMTADGLRSRVEAGMRATAGVFPDRGPKPDAWSEAGWRRRGPYDKATVEPLAASLGVRSRVLFSATFAAAMVLVLLGALNASALLAARSADRDGEFGIRRAFGAPRRAIGQSVLVEVLLLFLLAAVAAGFIAPVLVRTTLPLFPERTVLFKPWGADAFGWREFGFLAGLALWLAVLGSVWPALRALRSAPATAAPAGRSTERRSRGRSMVIATQTAGALLLTVVGALLVGSLLSVYGQGLSIRTDGIIYIEASLSGGRLPDAGARAARVAPVLEGLRQTPGVRDVTLMAGQTLFGAMPEGGAGMVFDTPDAPRYRSPHAHAVTADYYRILQPELVAGRLPTDEELTSGSPVAVLSETLARIYWPNETPLGRTIGGHWDDQPYEVVGVVRDVPWLAWDTATPTAYGPYAPLSFSLSTITLFIDAGDRPSQVTRAVLAELEAMTPSVWARRAGNLIDIFAETVNARRFRSWLFGGFAASALVVVGVGILGLLAMSTARRTREVGIRQALGATPGSIVGLFVREQMRPVLAGLALGAIVAAWAVGFVESYLFGVTTTDPRVWGAAVVLILVTAGAGALIPSLRASTTDPTIALRAE